jgi:signal transduction histidine kinase
VGWRAAGATVDLFVRDTGEGVPPEHRARIFDRFYRIDHGRADGGVGLGLAICRWIAEAHGGSIRLEAGEGPGSTFVVTLPRGVEG